MHSPAPLTGGAIGDALGQPFETLGPTSSYLCGWQGGYTSSDYHRLGPGQWTDDTQMSLALASSILDRGSYDPEHAAKAYLAWYASGDARGIGGTIRSAMQKLGMGTSWHGSGIEGSEGNGSAMRVAPLGLLHWKGTGRLKAAAHWARIDANITHASEAAREGSAAIVVAVSHLAAGGTKADLLTAVLDHIHKTPTHSALGGLYSSIRRADSFKEVIVAHGWALGGVSGRVTDTVTAAFALFLFSETFQDTVQNAVRLGGDTDTTAAMAGGLAGAHYGYDGIPKSLIAQLERADDIRTIELGLIG